jgi:hypothetical protein
MLGGLLAVSAVAGCSWLDGPADLTFESTRSPTQPAR